MINSKIESMFSYKITKRILMRDAPSWKWFAKRKGMGWQYVGRKNKALVIVKPFAVQCGPMEDDYTTQWRVDDGEKIEDYASWLIKIGRNI